MPQKDRSECLDDVPQQLKDLYEKIKSEEKKGRAKVSEGQQTSSDEKVDNNDALLTSYNLSYELFLKYAESIREKGTFDDYVCLAHMVYGWMPTILELRLEDSKENICKFLEEAGSEKFLDNENGLETLRKFMNNSYVGLSKLLHFLYPELYAIWDSRILVALEGGSPSHYKTADLNRFISYEKAMRTYCKDKLGIRNVEKKLFEVGRKKIKDKKEPKEIPSV